MNKLTTIKTKKQIAEVTELAREIWIDHYTPIIGSEQVEYMLDKYLSIEAISSQIEEGYEFYIINDGNRVAGFFSILPELKKQTVKLSKLYTHKSARGKGLGKKMLESAEKESREKGCSKLWLTVNKDNSNSISWYKRMGFVKTGELVIDIGHGFVMDDYKMEKEV